MEDIEINEEKKEEQNEEKKEEEQKEEKIDEVKEGIIDKKFIYIYFNKCFNKQIELKSISSEKAEELNDLEKLNTNESKTSMFDIAKSLYRFKIYPDKIKERNNDSKDLQIEITLEDGNKHKYKSILKDIDFEHDNYLYYFHLDIKEENINDEELSLVEYDLSHLRQFELYLTYLKEQNLNDIKTKEKRNFILSTLNNLFLKDKDYKYSFAFYLKLFSESYNSEYFIKVLGLLKNENIREFGILSKDELYKTFGILNSLDTKIFSIFEKEENKEELILNFYTIYLYMNCKYYKEKIVEMFKNEKIKKYLLKALIINEDFSNGLVLTKEQILEIINSYSDNLNFVQLKNQLKYNNDYLILLEIINEKKELILNKYLEYDDDDKEENLFINIELFAQPKIEDDIDSIYNQIKDIVLFEKNSNKYFIQFSQEFLKNYYDLFENTNLNKLLSLNKIVSLLKSEDKNYKLKYNVDEIVHRSGINLSILGKVNNMELLNFIEKDIYYTDKIYNNNNQVRSLEVLSGLDISKANEEFFQKWKKLNFFKIFEKQKELFLDKVCRLIKDMSQFNILFKLLDQNTDENKKEINYDYTTILKMQTTFEILMPTYSEENCPNFIDDVVDLIYYSDLKKANLESFNIDYIQKMLNYKIVNSIYISLAKKYTNLSKKQVTIIIDFFLKNPVNSNNINNLLYIIKNCNEFRKNLFSNMRNYIIKENDIYSKEESGNFKLLKEIIKENYISHDEKLLSTEYFSGTTEKVKDIIKKIKGQDISYYEILNAFYNNLEDVLKERLSIINQIIENDINKINSEVSEIITSLKNNTKTINNTLTDLRNILNDFIYFYHNKFKQEIIEFDDIHRKIREGNISLYLNQYKDKCTEFIEKYKKQAKERENLLNSVFFYVIHKEICDQYNDNDDMCLDESVKKIKELKIIFDDNFTVDNRNKSLLEVCLRNFNNKNLRQGLDKEIDLLAKIFDIKKQFDKDTIIINLILLSKKGELLNSAYSIILFIEKTGAVRTDFYETIKDIISKVESRDDINLVRNSMKELENKNIMNFTEKNNYIDVLRKFKDQPDAISFLFDISIDDCRKYQEWSLENDDEFITQNDILDLEKCVLFFEKLGKKNEIQKKADRDLISDFKRIANDDNAISIYIDKYINNYGQIKDLVNRGLDGSEISKKKILFIYESSEFTITNKKGEFFTCKYFEKNIKEKNALITRTLDMDKLLELRDRAQLSKVVTGDEKEKEIIQKNHIFIKNISQIMNLYKIVQDIYYKGYPKDIIIEIRIIAGEPKFQYDNKNINNYKEILPLLKSILDKLKETQINAYKEKPLIRYIYGPQFNLLYNAINDATNKNKFINKEIYQFLQYFTNNLITKNTIDNFEYKKDENSFNEFIINCENYLNKILTINNLTLEKIYKESLITKKVNNEEYQGLYIYLVSKLEKELFQIYKYLTSHTPSAQNILLCNEETSIEEIASFLYRAILCEFKSCFIVGGIELLKSEQKSFIIELLNEIFVDKHKEMKSTLIFLYTSKTTEIYKGLDSLKNKKVLSFDNAKNVENQKYDGNDIQIFYSDKSGVGKSQHIRNEVFNKSNYLIYFPFGGVISKEEMSKRLKKLKMDENTEIHLDLLDTDQIQLMMEFLFSILITKVYKCNENIFYFSKKVKIKIEIPNSFIDFFAKFPILDIFNKTKLSINKLSPLIISKKLTSKEQIICNYLKLLKENRLDLEDINFPSLSPKLDQSKFKKLAKKKNYKMNEAQIISDQECNNLIFETFKNYGINNPNYYQLNTFINVLGRQLEKFSQNVFLTAFNLLSIHDKHLQISTIRSEIVKNFINITKYFIQGAFDELLQSQIKTHEILFGQYDEGKDIKNAIDNLANKKSGVFSFSDINVPLLFFYEQNNDYFKLYTNNKIIKNNENQNLLKLYTMALLEREKQEKKAKKDKKEKEKEKEKEKKDKKGIVKFENENAKEKEQLFYLNELKEILELENPVKKDINKSEISESDSSKIKASSDINNKLLSLEEITRDYVFTSDNFVKMLFIFMRINANIPVIMMGETGCGKTALIRKLSELMNNGQIDKMKIFNIHAGTTDQDIIDFLTNKVIPDAVQLIIDETERKESYFNQNKIFFEKKIWVFLDEINTCKSMGLISELMCKNSYKGTSLPNNIIFIGACNPYRKTDIVKEEIGLNVNLAHQEKNNLNDNQKENIKKNSMRSKGKLVYTVNPLPHSLLNYVFDFGNLTPENESKYIENMIEDPIERMCNINNIEETQKNNIKEFTKSLIITSQNFIRDKNDISSVSLREIRRFNIFFQFFCQYLTFKQNNIQKLKGIFEFEKEYNFYGKMTNVDKLKYSIYLSIYICYFLRLTNKNLRYDFLYKTSKATTNVGNSKYTFADITKLEQEFLLKNIYLEKGISKNRALLENIFALFVAISNKVPIFIVGKPGSSKSLSVQLINRAMKGDLSSNLLFHSLPRLIISSYQGSMGSTSKGVENIFTKARDILKNVDKNKNISMIFFDEMGLAEHSPNNPLKVIHAELEYDLNAYDKKIAFVGISNWSLDASKMNRGIFISIPDPDEEDIIKTSLTIGNSFNEILTEKNKFFFQNLGKVYFKYKQYLKEKHNLDGKEDFHGNRDFYNLVKNCAQNITLKYTNEDISEKELINFGTKSIERNFAGMQFDDGEKLSSVEKVKTFFKEIYPSCETKKEYDIIERVKESICDINSRYLLVESKSSISTFLLSSILSELNKDYYFYIGSKFGKDLQSEEYILKVLNKVQMYMEQDKVLIMENLNSVYPAMYDLFNQNFTVVSNKKYAILAIGSTTNTYSLVNKDFKCIINVNINEMDKQEAPFLNRFEKQIITFDYLLSKELIDESTKISKILNNLTKKNSMHKGINYSLEKLLINCEIEEIQAIIYDANKRGIKKEELIDEVLSKISLTLPQDILIYLKYNGFSTKYKKEYGKILDFYNKGEHLNLNRFIQNMKNTKNVIYTFTSDINVIHIPEIKNEIFGTITEKNTVIINLNSINSETEFERYIDDFIINDDKLFIIQFTPEEGSLMNYVRFFIDNKEREYLNQNKEKKDDKKAFIFIMHLKRIFNSELKDLQNKSAKEQKEINKKMLKETLSNISGYYQIFIDNLNGKVEIQIDKFVNLKGSEAFSKCLDLEDELSKNIYTSFLYMKYNIKSSIGELNKDTYINKLISQFEYNKTLRKFINQNILDQLSNESNFMDKILKNQNSFSENDIDIISVIKNYMSSLYFKKLNLLYFKLEKDHYLSALLSYYEVHDKSENIFDILQNVFPDGSYMQNIQKDISEVIKNIVQNISDLYISQLKMEAGTIRVTERLGANNLDLLLGLNLPGVKPILDKLVKKVRDEVVNKYYQNEINLRENQSSQEQLKKDIEAYYNELSRYNSSTLIEIEKDEFINIIKNTYAKEPIYLDIFYYLMLNDYLTVYINNNLNKSNNNNARQNQNQNQINEVEKNNMNETFNIENMKKFLKLLISLKNKYSKYNDNISHIQKLANAINWLEAYETEITTILKMFAKLNNIIPISFDLINNYIYNETIKYEVSKRNPEFTGIVNKVFFYGMESILKLITMNAYMNFSKEDENVLTKMQNINKEILQEAIQLNTNMYLYSKEIYSLQEIVDLIDAFNMNRIGTWKNISDVVSYFSKESILIINNKINGLCDNLQKIFAFIQNKLGKSKDYHKIMNKILLNEFLKVCDDEYRMEILNIIFKDNEFIINSSQIFKVIIKNYISHDPSSDILDNLKTLYNHKNIVLIYLLNSISNPVLDEVLLNIFEAEINYYFKSIPLIKDKKGKLLYPKFFKDNSKFKEPKDFKGIVFDQSFNLFTLLYDHLERILIYGVNQENNSNLSKLYAIAYIKIYLKYFVTYLKEAKDAKEFKAITNYFNYKSIYSNKYAISNSFKKVVHIYILKLFNSLMENFNQFKNLKFEDYGIQFHKNFSLWQKVEKKSSDVMNYCFITMDDEKDKNNFFKFLEIFERERVSGFKSQENIMNNIRTYGMDTFVSISINKIISELGYDQVKNQNDVTNYYNLIKGLYPNNAILKNLLCSFFSTTSSALNARIKTHISKKNIITKIDNINTKLFEILLYSYRFCLQSLDNPDTTKKRLYSSILSYSCANTLPAYFIPGNEYQEDLHITTLEFVENHLNSNPDNIGCYICSCGYYYSIQPCGFPTYGSTSTCPVCKLKIGYGERKIIVGYHGLVRRPGHYRIFKDENQHKTCMNRYHDSDENVPNMTLAKYKTDIINPLLNKSQKGLNAINLDQFLKRNKKIRDLNELSYRIINFINYSHLYFANICNLIFDNTLETYLVKGLKCIEILEKDWDIIKEILQQKGIQSIQIFMNLIFKRLSSLIKNCECFANEILRNSFEKKVEDLVNKCVGEYRNYYNKFVEENQKLLKIDNYDIQTIINELVPPTENIYPYNEYPLLQNFILTKYSTKAEFIKKLGPSNIYAHKYPLLYQYLLDNIDTKKMKYLPDFNEFTNYMVENYSFKISRDDAKKRVLNKENIFYNSNFKNKYKNFINAWNEIKSEAIKYKCRPEMKPKDLKDTDQLIYFLNDDGELGYGMYLAAAGQNFITWQNSFLQPIIDNVAQNGILHHFVKSMQRKIPVQSAKISQSLLIEDCFNNSPYYDLEDIISTFCRRDIFKKDGTINYVNYNSFIYDFSSIEEELGKLLLPGKCLFENEDMLNFVTYWSEGFRGGKSDTLSNFYLKYPQKDLDDYETLLIFEYINYKKNKNFKPFFGSIQLILFYLSNNLYKSDEKIINIINNAPKYLQLSSICMDFFSKEGKELKIEKLMNVFFFIEHLCFEDLSQTLQPEYKKDIPNDLKEKIKGKLLKEDNKNENENEGFTINQLASAVRRYISRYLAGKRESVDIDEKRDLCFDLARIDLWEEKIGRLDNLDELLYAKIGEFKLIVGQAYEFYKLIQNKDKSPLDQINSNKKKIYS